MRYAWNRGKTSGIMVATDTSDSLRNRVAVINCCPEAQTDDLVESAVKGTPKLLGLPSVCGMKLAINLRVALVLNW